jgi:hypothetical protein
MQKGLHEYPAFNDGRWHDMLDSSGRYVGTSVDSRNSWETWKSATTIESLTAFLEDFVARHADDVAQDERWRAKMMRRIGHQFESMENKLAAQTALLKTLVDARPDVPPVLVKQKSKPSRLRSRGGSSSEAKDVGERSDATDAQDARLAFCASNRKRREQSVLNARSAALFQA